MGNGNGCLGEFYDAFESVPGFQGGFIWQWVDHGLKQRDARGREYWAYGGDFGDRPNDANFLCGGLVFPDRTPHTGLIELKKVGATGRHRRRRCRRRTPAHHEQAGFHHARVVARDVGIDDQRCTRCGREIAGRCARRPGRVGGGARSVQTACCLPRRRVFPDGPVLREGRDALVSGRARGGRRAGGCPAAGAHVENRPATRSPAAGVVGRPRGRDGAQRATGGHRFQNEMEP